MPLESVANAMVPPPGSSVPPGSLQKAAVCPQAAEAAAVAREASEGGSLLAARAVGSASSHEDVASQHSIWGSRSNRPWTEMSDGT